MFIWEDGQPSQPLYRRSQRPEMKKHPISPFPQRFEHLPNCQAEDKSFCLVPTV